MKEQTSDVILASSVSKPLLPSVSCVVQHMRAKCQHVCPKLGESLPGITLQSREMPHHHTDVWCSSQHVASCRQSQPKILRH
eukprot:2371784-Amphidinium_carterae.1